MLFKDLSLTDEFGLSTPLRDSQAVKSPLKALLDNQSPVMKVWFVVMIINMGLFVALLR